jgi:hypothetical protein
MDGDMDLFIGSGPAGSLARDFNYRNLLAETSLPYLKRLDTGILGTDLVDGQNYSIIDYDNDGDLDAYLTNYRFGTPNNLYRNEGNGYYARMTSAQAGRIASDSGASLSNTWADFDNDGDLDCYVTNDNSFTTRYYSNNGDGTFTRLDSIAVRESGPKYGAVAGDYDNDGDVDLYVSGAILTKALYENITDNGNRWVNIKCTGVNANRSAIGARVKVKAVINGLPGWQLREINSQNSFNSMNMLNVHFGLGNATIIDSVVVEWPRGGRQVFTGIAVNSRYNLIEGMSLTTGTGSTGSEQPGSFRLGQNFPNPFNPQTRIEVDLTEDSKITLEVFDLLGRKVGQIAGGRYSSGRHIFAFDAIEYHGHALTEVMQSHKLKPAEW